MLLMLPKPSEPVIAEIRFHVGLLSGRRILTPFEVDEWDREGSPIRWKGMDDVKRVRRDR